MISLRHFHYIKVGFMLKLHFDYQGLGWHQNMPCFLKGHGHGWWTGLDHRESEIMLRYMDTVYYCDKCTKKWGEVIWHDVDSVHYCATCTRAHGEPVWHAVDEGLAGDWATLAVVHSLAGTGRNRFRTLVWRRTLVCFIVFPVIALH